MKWLPPPERAHLVCPLGKLAEGLEELRMAIGQRLEPRLEGTGHVSQHSVVVVLSTTDRHISADLVKDFLL